MADPSSQIIASWIKQALDSSDWLPLRDVCFTAIRKQLLKRSEDDAWDIVESNLIYIAEHLRNELSECLVDGTSPLFEVDSEPSPYIRLLPSPASDVLVHIRQIDPFELEKVCAAILHELGAESYTTQQTNDGGVDFIGANLSIVPKALSIPLACKAVVIGQAKRYQSGNVINERQLREFVGAATLHKYKVQTERKFGPLAPILFAFWTTSDFDPNAKRFAREIGLWYMAGQTLASYISSLGLRELVMALPKASPH